MSYTTVPDKATGSVFTEANWDTHIKDNLNKGVPRPIADILLAADAASITFSSIAADYAHLLLMGYARVTGAAIWGDLWLRFNGDSSANYDNQYLQGFGGTPAGGETLGTTAAVLGLIPFGGAMANSFGAVCTWIGYYAGSANNKSYVSSSSAKYQNSASGMVWRSYGGHWRSNAAINQITLVSNTGETFLAGTKFTLYGMGWN